MFMDMNLLVPINWSQVDEKLQGLQRQMKAETGAEFRGGGVWFYCSGHFPKPFQSPMMARVSVTNTEGQEGPWKMGCEDKRWMKLLGTDQDPVSY